MSKRIILPLGIDGHVHARDMDQAKTMTIMQTCIEAKNSETPPEGLATEQHIIPIILSLKNELGLDENDIANLISNNSANFLEIDTPKGSSTWELTSENNVVSYNNGNVYNPFYNQLMIGQFIEEGESDEY